MLAARYHTACSKALTPGRARCPPYQPTHMDKGSLAGLAQGPFLLGPGGRDWILEGAAEGRRHPPRLSGQDWKNWGLQCEARVQGRLRGKQRLLPGPGQAASEGRRGGHTQGWEPQLAQGGPPWSVPSGSGPALVCPGRKSRATAATCGAKSSLSHKFIHLMPTPTHVGRSSSLHLLGSAVAHAAAWEKGDPGGQQPVGEGKGWKGSGHWG